LKKENNNINPVNIIIHANINSLFRRRRRRKTHTHHCKYLNLKLELNLKERIK